MPTVDFEIRGKGKADYSPSVQSKHKFCLFVIFSVSDMRTIHMLILSSEKGL